AVYQMSDFIFSVFGNPDVVILFGGHGLSRCGKLEDWPRNKRLQPYPQGQPYPCCHPEHQQAETYSANEPLVKFFEVSLQQNGSQSAAIEHYRMKHLQMLGSEYARVLLQRGGRGNFPAVPDVAGERFAFRVEDD